MSVSGSVLVDVLIPRSTFIVPPTYHVEMNEDCYLDQHSHHVGICWSSPILGLDSSSKKSLQNGEHMCFCWWEIPMKISGVVSQKFEIQPIDREVKMSLR